MKIKGNGQLKNGQVILIINDKASLTHMREVTLSEIQSATELQCNEETYEMFLNNRVWQKVIGANES